MVLLCLLIMTVYNFFQAMRSCQSMVALHKACPTLKPLPFSRGFALAKLLFMSPAEMGVTQSKWQKCALIILCLGVFFRTLWGHFYSGIVITLGKKRSTGVTCSLLSDQNGSLRLSKCQDLFLPISKNHLEQEKPFALCATSLVPFVNND